MYDTINKIIYKLYAWKNVEATTPLVYTKSIPTSTSEVLYNSSGVAIVGIITAYTSTTITVTINDTSVLYTYSLTDDKGINLYDVQKALGRSTPDLGCLCSDIMYLFAWVNGTVTYYTVNPTPIVGTPLYSVSGNTKTPVGRITGIVSTNDVVTSVVYNSTTYTKTTSSNTSITMKKINRWSFHKPVRYTSQRPLTDDIFSGNTVNLGFSLGDSSGVKSADKTTVLSYAAAAATSDGGNWPYLLPRGFTNTEYYRLTDFHNYNGNAKCFGDNLEEISPNYFMSVGNEGAVVTMAHTYNGTLPSPLEIHPLMLSAFENTTWRWAVIYKKSGNVEASMTLGAVVTMNTGCTAINTTITAAGNYEMCLALTAMNDVTIPDNSFFVPHSYRTFMVHNTPEYYLTPYQEIITGTSNHYPSVEVVVDSTTNEVTQIITRWRGFNYSTTSRTVYVRFTIYLDVTSAMVTLEQAVTIPAGGTSDHPSVVLNFNYGNNTGEFSYTTIASALYISAAVCSVSGSNSSAVHYVDFTNVTISMTSVSPVQLSTLLESE